MGDTSHRAGFDATDGEPWVLSMTPLALSTCTVEETLAADEPDAATADCEDGHDDEKWDGEEWDDEEWDDEC